MPRIEPSVPEKLADLEISGGVLRIRSQLSPQEYVAVNRVLPRLGGQWDRRAGGQQEEGYYATPPDLARRIVGLYTFVLGMKGGLVLEPSAGDGALVAAIRGANPALEVAAVEPHQQRADRIPRDGGVQVWTSRFEDWIHVDDRPKQVDAVIMNPPFTSPGRTTAWIDHLWLAWRLVSPGGRVTCIAPHSLTSRDDRRHREVRALLDRHGGWEHLPDHAFAAPGTNTRTVVAWADKPQDWSPSDDPRERRRRRPTPEEREEYRREDVELRRAVDEALEDPEFAASMAERLAALPPDCRLRQYSPRNQALVLTQADALGVRVTGHLGTVREWRELGRRVRRGATGLRICAAMGTETQDESQEEPERTPRFRMTARFDVSQTEAVND